MTLIDHYERFLGRVKGACTVSDVGEQLAFPLLECCGGPLGVVAWATLGFSKTPLPSAESGRMLREELFMMNHPRCTPANMAAVLYQAAMRVVSSGKALLRGNVLGPAGPLFASSNLTALYAAMPVYLSDEFNTYTDSDGNRVAIVWLVPITDGEAAFVRLRGWRDFEEALELANPDLLDYTRGSAC